MGEGGRVETEGSWTDIDLVWEWTINLWVVEQRRKGGARWLVRRREKVKRDGCGPSSRVVVAHGREVPPGYKQRETGHG